MSESSIVYRRAVEDERERTGQLVWVNALRILTAVAVVLVHTAHLYVQDWGKISAIDWWIATVVDSALRWCVPIFVLVSGALLLNPTSNEDAWTFARKRANRVLLPLAFWTTVYLAWRFAFEGLPLNEAPRLLLEGIPYYHLWYLYMVPGLYLITPFLRTYLRAAPLPERRFLTGVLLLLAATGGFINYFVRPTTQTVFTLFLPYVAYYLAGYELHDDPPTRLRSGWLLAILAGSIILIALGTGLLVQTYGVINQGLYLYDYLSPPVIAASLSIYLLLMRSGARRRFGPRLEALIQAVAPATLGIYVIHALVLAGLRRFGGVEPASLPAAFGIPAVGLLAFGCSYLIASVMMRVPALRRTVGQ